MKYNNTVEYQDAINQLVKRNMDIIKLAKTESRELDEEEEKEFDENEKEIKELEDEKDELEKELENPKEDEKEQKNTNISIDKNMEKKFSLVEEIKRSMETHQPIILNRAGEPNYTVTVEGEDTVATEIWDVLEPLRQENILVGLGARLYTGLVGDVQIPVLSGANVGWKGEVAAADDGSGSFSSVTLSPKRITGKFPISLQFLAQTTPDVEAAIRRDIAFALNAKLEETLLGDEAGSATKPAGLFYGLTPETVNSYADLNEVVAGLEEANYKNIAFALSPSAKGYMKGLIKGTNATGMVYEGGEVDGYKAATSSNIESKMALAGAFDQVVMGVWGDIRIDVVADSATLANGQIMIIVNSFMDGKVCRDSALVAIDTTEE